MKRLNFDFCLGDCVIFINHIPHQGAKHLEHIERSNVVCHSSYADVRGHNVSTPRGYDAHSPSPKSAGRGRKGSLAGNNASIGTVPQSVTALRGNTRPSQVATIIWLIDCQELRNGLGIQTGDGQMMGGKTRFLTYADYLTTPEDTRYELRGELVATPAPNEAHQRTQANWDIIDDLC